MDDVSIQPVILAAIDGAEEVVDALDHLVERTGEYPGAPFTPQVLVRLRQLKAEDVPAFETLRSQLRKAGCRIALLDDAITPESGSAGGRTSQADLLIQLAGDAELFHSADGSAFADVIVGGHRETWPLRSRGFRRWLTQRFYQETSGAPGPEAVQSAINVLEARAHFDGPDHPVFIRVGGLDGSLYLDLADATWRAVEIDASGWRIVDAPPVRFRRPGGLQTLPAPVRGGSIDALRPFLNVQCDGDFVLVVTWMLAVLRDRGPYPVLALSGEQGSAKSTFSAILRALVDPNTAPLRALPREDRDLFIAAGNGHILAFDNVSGLPAWISDTLCRLSTGGGFAIRQLYTDQDEILFDAARPLILNGIEDIISRPDLADRAIFLTLQPIPEEQRRPEAELWAAFRAERASLLGVLLDGVVEGLERLPTTHLPKLPRMADFALWAAACEARFWPRNTFWAAYCDNRNEAIDDIIDADPVASALRMFMADRTTWAGTASNLLDALALAAGDRVSRTKTWPNDPRILSGRLRRAATFLRTVGIEIAFAREGRMRTRIIRIDVAHCSTGSSFHEASAFKPGSASASSAGTSRRIGGSSACRYADAGRGCGRWRRRTVGHRPHGGPAIRPNDRCGRCGR